MSDGDVHRSRRGDQLLGFTLITHSVLPSINIRHILNSNPVNLLDSNRQLSRWDDEILFPSQCAQFSVWIMQFLRILPQNSSLNSFGLVKYVQLNKVKNPYKQCARWKPIESDHFTDRKGFSLWFLIQLWRMKTSSSNENSKICGGFVRLNNIRIFFLTK